MGVVTDRDDPNGTPPQPSLPSQGREQRLAASAAPAGPLRTQEKGRAVRGLFNVAATVTDSPARLTGDAPALRGPWRSEEHTSELQSLMRISYAVFCLKKTHS